MRADLMQATCTFVGPDKHSQENQRKLVWKTRLFASSDFTKTKKKTARKTSLFLKNYPKTHKIPKNPRDLP
jgi:hypothetical protein